MLVRTLCGYHAHREAIGHLPAKNVLWRWSSALLYVHVCVLWASEVDEKQLEKTFITHKL